VAKQSVVSPSPADHVDRALAALDADIHDDFHTMYRALEGCEIEADEGPEIAIFDLDEIVDVRGQTGYREALPSALFFASDGSSGWYYLDLDGSICGTRGAVLWGDRGSMSRETSRPAADDLADFLVKACRGKLPPLVRVASFGERASSD
jgi:hypothetical protein